MSYIIYLHRNKINNKVYIGQTKNNPTRRWENGKGYKNTYFGNAIQKYGWDNFEHEILETDIETVEEANQRETYYIELYNATNRDLGYNIFKTAGGYDSTNRPVSEIQRERGRELGKKVWTDPEFRKKRCQQVKCVETNQIFDCYRSAGEWCGLIYYKNSFLMYFRGERQSCGKHPETKEPLHWVKINQNGEELLGIQNFDSKKSDRSEKCKKSIICINTGEVFESLNAAAAWCGLKNTSGISNQLKGRKKSAGKHPVTGEKLVWKYKEEE